MSDDGAEAQGMARSSPPRGAVVVLEPADMPVRYPRAIARKPLNTIRDVREEMARVYRACASGKISTKQGNAMTYMLSMISKTIEVEKIETQLDALERAKEGGR